MGKRQGTTNWNPRRLENEVAKLKAQVDALLKKVTQLEAELAKARKNSANSSKPPSSDIVKPTATGKKSGNKKKNKRKQGAQPGHPRHERDPFSEEQIDHFWDYTYHGCPDCGHPVTPTDDPERVVQQIELIPTPVTISEHRSLAYWCEHCQKMHYAPIHPEVQKAGLVGPRLTALVAYLKGACHCSFSVIRKFLRDVVGVSISRGQLRKVCAKVSNSLQDPYEELLEMLPVEDFLNVDETGHKDKGQRMWTWCFRSATFTLFKIDPSRGSQVLVKLLGEEFDGVLGCDYFSAYRKYMKDFDVHLQFCLAHFIRDVKFLVEHPDSKNRAYGRRVLKATRTLFEIIHRRDRVSETTFRRRLEQAGDALWRQATFRVPQRSEAQNLANRFLKHGESYIRFITTPGIEPTNNLAEQAIRFVVIDRQITQGSRSESGQRWLERIWSTIATCTQRGCSVFEFLCESVHAYFHGHPAPSLLSFNDSS
jgi:transposase